MFRIYILVLLAVLSSNTSALTYDQNQINDMIKTDRVAVSTQGFVRGFLWRIIHNNT